MAALKNQKWESFTQWLARGLSTDAAYEKAGYTPNRGNAARLKANESVLARLAELQARAAQRTEITVAGITERLMRVADVAEQTGIDYDPDGKLSASSSKHLGILKGALMDVARLNGLVIEKRDIDLSLEATVDVQVSSDRERAKAMAALFAKMRDSGNDEGKS